MGELFTPTHLIVIAVVVLVLFGGKKLPELGKGLGEGLSDCSKSALESPPGTATTDPLIPGVSFM